MSFPVTGIPFSGLELDDSRPENGIPVSGNDMRSALEAMCNGKEISVAQKPSIGCNIKWKS